MKVVIDTNVFISSFLGGVPRQIIDLWKEQKITLCLSEKILEEYLDVLGRIGLTEETELEELLSLFKKGYNLRFTARTPKLAVVKTDPADDKFIECAVALGASAIITGDRGLLAIGRYQGIVIVNPRKFLEDFSPDQRE